MAYPTCTLCLTLTGARGGNCWCIGGEGMVQRQGFEPCGHLVIAHVGDPVPLDMSPLDLTRARYIWCWAIRAE